MGKRLIALTATVVALGLMAAPFSVAQVDGTDGNATVTATVVGGTRSVTVSGAVALTNAAVGVNTATGSYAVTVAEAGRSGTNPWSVQADISDLARVGELTTLIERRDVALVQRDVTVPAATIVGNGGQPTKDAAYVGPHTTNNTFGASLDNAATPQVLFEIDGEDPGSAYTNTYVGSGDLEADVTGAPAGTYTGTIVYDLIQ